MKIIVNNANFPIALPFVETYTMRAIEPSLRLPSRRLASGNKIRISDSANLFTSVYLYKKDNSYITVNTNEIITLTDNYDNVFFWKSAAIGTEDELKIEILGDAVVYDEITITCDAVHNTAKSLSQNVISGDMVIGYTVSDGTYSDGYFMINGASPLQMVSYTKLVNRLNISSTYNQFRIYLDGATSALLTLKVWRPLA